MDLAEVVIEDLFGEFTHTITLNTVDGLTLLHGANGVGKTTVLRIIDSLFNRNFGTLRQMPFSGVTAKFGDGTTLYVKRSAPEGKYYLDFRMKTSESKDQAQHYWRWERSIEPRSLPSEAFEEFLPEIVRVGAREWHDTSTGELLDVEGVLDRYGSRLPFPVERYTGRKGVPEWLSKLTTACPVFFIRTERLTSPGRNQAHFRPGRTTAQTPTVKTFAQDLAEKIQQALASYSNYSQKLDSTFPARLLEADVQTVTPDEKLIRQRYAEEGERRSGYVKAGLLDRDAELQLPDRELNDGELRVLGTYLADVKDKLTQLDEIAEKIELFLQIINTKFRRKRVYVDRRYGFHVISNQDTPLDLESLSSGEQQEIVLTYGLLFREKPGTLVLIDEPELSLHVAWQNDFIPDLLRIAEIADLSFLIATHSPSIINEHWELTQELAGGE